MWKSVFNAGNQDLVAVEDECEESDESEESTGSDDADNSASSDNSTEKNDSSDSSEVSDASEQEEAALADTGTSSAGLVTTPERVRPCKKRRQPGSDDAEVYV